MKQHLKVDLTVIIPDDYVLVEKIEYERLQEVDTYGRWWTLRDVLDRVNREVYSLERMYYTTQNIIEKST